jgi:hypothetical protein
MSCYLRHLKELFEESGVSVSKENKKEVDAFLHEQVGMDRKHCPSAWRELKKIVHEKGSERAKLVKALKKRFGAA